MTRATSTPNGPGSRRGFTLAEIAIVLLLWAILTGMTVPSVRSLLDRSAVVGAREAVAGLIVRTRGLALDHGGATIEITRDPARVLVRSASALVDSLRLGTAYGVEVSLSRDRTGVELHFDALGLGRVASETIRFHRNGATAVLVVSGYGRVRRQ